MIVVFNAGRSLDRADAARKPSDRPLLQLQKSTNMYKL
jgi:hypothetical protein